MDYLGILQGNEEFIPIYTDIIQCLEDITRFPGMIEPIYRNAITLDEQTLEKLRFGLLRLQIYSEINRHADMEESQKIRFVSEMIERTVYGGLFIEREEFVPE